MSSVVSRTVLRAAALDAASILAFVAAGRRSHDEGGNPISGMFEVAAPFLVALAVAWVVVRAWRRPDHLRTGVALWAITVSGGMVLRRFVFDRGTAPSFVVVAALGTALLLLGWRLVVLIRSEQPATGAGR